MSSEFTTHVNSNQTIIVNSEFYVFVFTYICLAADGVGVRVRPSCRDEQH